MTRPVRFGVTLPQVKRTWAEARAAAVEFDRLGFDSVWVCDHLYGVPLPHLPIFEAWSELAAVAAITERVELGTLVTPPFFRNPAVFAKQVATIDQVANGRVIVGLGGGWFAAEFEALGRRCREVGRDFDSLEVSQQCLVVIAETEDGARGALERAGRIYGGHMGAGLEAHGIWGTPAQVIERIRRHTALGCTLFVMEFFGRDTREPARLFAEQVLPAFR